MADRALQLGQAQCPSGLLTRRPAQSAAERRAPLTRGQVAEGWVEG
jgi:hypothetical protein